MRSAGMTCVKVLLQFPGENATKTADAILSGMAIVAAGRRQDATPSRLVLYGLFL
jgi:hypothetical protein